MLSFYDIMDTDNFVGINDYHVLGRFVIDVFLY